MSGEVWLVVAGGTLFLAFPVLFAVAFSGFYLPLTLVLWLLIFRALGIELRHLLPHPLFSALWDASFAGASALLTFALGAALGCVVRGVSIDAEGHFFAPLWTKVWWPAPGAPGQVGVLDAYTALCGLSAVAVLALHGALWLSHRVEGVVATRAQADAPRLLGLSALLVTALTVATLYVQPNLASNLSSRPVGLLALATGLLALGVLGSALRAARYERAFWASSLFIVALLASAAYAIFPYVLPARDPSRGLTLYAAANHAGALTIALYWWIPGVLLGAGYCAFAYRMLPHPRRDAQCAPCCPPKSS